jgi:hypothetical protein
MEEEMADHGHGNQGGGQNQGNNQGNNQNHGNKKKGQHGPSSAAVASLAGLTGEAAVDIGQGQVEIWSDRLAGWLTLQPDFKSKVIDPMDQEALDRLAAWAAVPAGVVSTGLRELLQRRMPRFAEILSEGTGSLLRTLPRRMAELKRAGKHTEAKDPAQYKDAIKEAALDTFKPVAWCDYTVPEIHHGTCWRVPNLLARGGNLVPVSDPMLKAWAKDLSENKPVPKWANCCSDKGAKLEIKQSHAPAPNNRISLMERGHRMIKAEKPKFNRAQFDAFLRWKEHGCKQDIKDEYVTDEDGHLRDEFESAEDFNDKDKKELLYRFQEMQYRLEQLLDRDDELEDMVLADGATRLLYSRNLAAKTYLHSAELELGHYLREAGKITLIIQDSNDRYRARLEAKGVKLPAPTPVKDPPSGLAKWWDEFKVRWF